MRVDKEVIDKIELLNSPAVIAVSGFGGSGKTTLANALGDAIQAPVIGVDSFVRDRTLLDYSKWELMDFGRLENEVLKPFTAGKNPVHYGHFDWERNIIVENREIYHDGRIVVEGVGLFRLNLLQYFAHTIWVDCPIEEATGRGMKRDREQYKNPLDESWAGVWKKNDLEYFEAFKPKERARSVIVNC